MSYINVLCITHDCVLIGKTLWKTWRFESKREQHVTYVLMITVVSSLHTSEIWCIPAFWHAFADTHTFSVSFIFSAQAACDPPLFSCPHILVIPVRLLLGWLFLKNVQKYRRYQEACSDMVFVLGQAGSSQWMFLMQHQFLCCGCNYLNFNKSLQQGNIACVQAVHAGVCACCSE